MEKKYKIKTNGQPIAMPCTQEQWEVLKPELDKIEGVDCEDVTDTFDFEPILVNNATGEFGKIANLVGNFRFDFTRTYIDTHDKEAFLNSLRGEPIKKEVKPVFTPPYRLGKKQKRAVLDANSREVILFPIGQEIEAQEYVDFLNKKESPFNDEYWQRLYHECALRLWVNKHALYFTEDAIREAKMLIEELKNNPLK